MAPGKAPNNCATALGSTRPRVSPATSTGATGEAGASKVMPQYATMAHNKPNKTTLASSGPSAPGVGGRLMFKRLFYLPDTAYESNTDRLSVVATQ